MGLALVGDHLDLTYECLMVGDKTILLVKFRPELEFPLCSLTPSLKVDKLVNTGGNFYVVKLVFARDGRPVPGESGLMWSSNLLQMLPQVSSVSASPALVRAGEVGDL